MEIRQLYYFLEIVKQGSFSKAAQTLYISQPTISQQIASLEQELNMNLLYRTTKKVALTAEGEEFLQYCKEVVSAYDRLLEFCGKKPGGQETLHIGVFPFYKSIDLGQIISSFYLQHQDISGMMKLVENNDAYGLLEQGKLNFAIIKCRDDVLRSDMHYDELRRENLRVLISREHPLASQPFVSVTQLDVLPILTGEKESHYYQEMETLYQRIGIPFTTKFQNTLETEMMMEMVEAGAGILLISDSAGIFSENERVISVPLQPPQEVSIYLAHHKAAKLRSVDKAFRAYILDYFRRT